MKFSYLVSLSAAIALFSGCGSSDSSNDTAPSTITGQFIDSAVQGLDYVCSSGGSGVTNAFGHFTCNIGDTVTFSLNSFEIGSARAETVITPKTLHPNDTEAMINIAQLLQTLDSDGNPDNGISIDTTGTEVQSLSGITVALDQADFDSVITSYIGTVLVDESTALAHLELNIENTQNSTAITSLSSVYILNGTTDSFCAARNPYDASYDGYSDFTDFVNAGGSSTFSYTEGSQECSAYSQAGLCLAQDFTVQIGGAGSCVQVITFPSTQTTTPDSTTLTPPVLTHTFNTDTDVQYVENNSYLRFDTGILYLVNAMDTNDLWQYEAAEGAEDITIIKISTDKIVIKIRTWSGSEFVKFISKSDGVELKSISLTTLGSISLNADDSVLVQQNGWNTKLISVDGNIILDSDNIPVTVSNDTMIVLNDRVSNKLLAYDFNANLLWENNTTCSNMIMDDNAVYCEQVINIGKKSTIVKIDAVNGGIVSQNTFSRLGKLHQNGTNVFADVNGWDINGNATYSFIAIDKNTLEEAWSVNSQNIVALDTTKELLYANLWTGGYLNAYNLEDGTPVFSTEFQNYSALSINSDSSILTQSYTGTAYEYSLYQYETGATTSGTGD